MKALGRIATYLALSALALLVLLFSLGAVAYVTVLDPSFYKSRLAASDVYESMGAVQARLLFIDVDQSDTRVATEIDLVTPYFEQALNPALVEGLSDDILESVGDWLDGLTATPVFAVDTKAIRIELATYLADYMKTRLAALPPCTSIGADYDPFTSECRPPFAISDADYLAFSDSLISELPLLGHDQITSSSVIKDPAAAAWDTVPRTYWGGKVALGSFAAALVLLSGLAVAVSRQKPKVLSRLGGVAGFTAAVLFVGAAIAGLWLGRAGFDSLHATTPKGRGFAEDILLPIVHSLANGVGMWLAIFGAIWALIAAGCFVAARALRRRSDDQDVLPLSSHFPHQSSLD